MSAVGGKADRTSEINNLANEIPLGVINGVTLRNGPVARILAAVSAGALAGLSGWHTGSRQNAPRRRDHIRLSHRQARSQKKSAEPPTVQRGLL